MTPIKKTLIASTLIGLFAIGGVAVADPGGPMGMFRIGRVIHELNLTEAQEDQAIAMKKAIMKEGKETRRNAMGSLGEVAAELKKPKPDAAQLHKIADQRMDDMRKLVHFAIDRFLTFHASLDAKQRGELADNLERAERRAKKWQAE